MAKPLRIVWPGLPPVAYSANSRQHWRARRGKSGANNQVYADMVILVAEAQWDRVTMERAIATVTFHLPDRRRIDHGSLIERMKPLWDALVRVGVLADDSMDVIGFPDYQYEHRKPGATIIDLEAVL